MYVVARAKPEAISRLTSLPVEQSPPIIRRLLRREHHPPRNDMQVRLLNFKAQQETKSFEDHKMEHVELAHDLWFGGLGLTRLLKDVYHMSFKTAEAMQRFLTAVLYPVYDYDA